MKRKEGKTEPWHEDIKSYNLSDSHGRIDNSFNLQFQVRFGKLALENLLMLRHRKLQMQFRN